MPTKIIINDNGSIKIEGEVQLFDSKGNQYDLSGRTIFSLCRCGHSNKKPFCDGSHKTANFNSVCEAYTLPPVVKKI